MKIEKGRLYYDTLKEEFFKCKGNQEYAPATNKIVVHCPTKEDWEYVVSNGYDLWMYCGDFCYTLYSGQYDTIECFKNEESYTTLTIDQFKYFYPPTSKEEQKKAIIDLYDIDKYIASIHNEVCEELIFGKKESNSKLYYELDFSFITQLAERMQTNKGKYEPYNWKKPIDVEDLKQALFRHVIEVMNGNYIDDGREYGHLEAIACNVMMINYQLKNNK